MLLLCLSFCLCRRCRRFSVSSDLFARRGPRAGRFAERRLGRGCLCSSEARVSCVPGAAQGRPVSRVQSSSFTAVKFEEFGGKNSCTRRCASGDRAARDRPPQQRLYSPGQPAHGAFFPPLFSPAERVRCLIGICSAARRGPTPSRAASPRVLRASRRAVRAVPCARAARARRVARASAVGRVSPRFLNVMLD